MPKIMVEIEVSKKDCNDCDYFDFLCSMCTIFNKKVSYVEDKNIHKRCDECKRAEVEEQRH